MKKRIITLLIILLMLVTLAPPVAFAENVIHIATAKDLEDLAKKCVLDSYSKDITVILDADIDLTGKRQPSIPIFSGIFEGGGHTISGFELALDGYDLGLFRIIASGGRVRNLNVKGYVDPENVRNNIGGIAGSNYGLIEGCTFSGNVRGNMRVGGLVGYNFGAIIASKNEGVITGKTNTGGIAGRNDGIILSSANEGKINTDYEVNDVSLENINILDITSIAVSATDENVVSNTGGIVGTNIGVIKACFNKAQIGHQHYGYNVGGIAGIQSGFITDCENHGEVFGRKDVGGLVGQMEPYLILTGQASMADELLALSDSVDKSIKNFDDNTNQGKQQKDSLQDEIEKALEDVYDYNKKHDVVDVPGDDPEKEQTKQDAKDGISDALKDGEQLAKDVEDSVGSDTIGKLIDGTATDKEKEKAKDSALDKLQDTAHEEVDSADGGAKKIIDTFGEDNIQDAIDGNLTEEQKEEFAQKGRDIAGDAYDNKDQIVDGIKEKAGEIKDDKEQEKKDQDELTTDIDNVSTSMSSFLSVLSNTADGLSSDLKVVNSNYIEVMTLAAALLSGNYVDIQDISDTDTEENLDGKVRNSINFGTVSGDSNVGGISGEMAIEMDFDLEGIYTSELTSKELVSKTYESKCVARNCINRGRVEGRKDNIGGITGSMQLGTVINCESYGPISADESTYVGGIAGVSRGTISSCYAMCSITGESYIGGIAGGAHKIFDSITLVEIRGAQSSYGTIAGYAEMNLKADLTSFADEDKLSDDGKEEENTECYIKGNFYVHDSVGAINGISYEGFAEPIEYSELIKNEKLPDDFRELKIIYIADGVTVGEVEFTYGGSLDESKIPEVPLKDGYAGYWPEYDYSELYFSDTLEAIYTVRGIALETEKHREDSEMPIVLVEGSFDDASTIAFEEYEAEGLPTGTIEAWKLKLTGNHDKDNAFIVHYYEPETNLFTRMIIYVLDDNGEWQKATTTESGSYMMINGTGNQMIFASAKAPSTLFIIMASSAVVILLGALYIALKKKKSSR